MKVLILTSSNPNRIAGIVSKDLLNALDLNSALEVKLLVREYANYKESNIISVITKFRNFRIRVSNRIRLYLKKTVIFRKQVIKTDPNYEYQIYDQSQRFFNTNSILNKIDFRPDAIIILFMERFLNFENLAELKKYTKARIYLYLMDMAIFTGGCHYSWGCTRYEENCGECPALWSDNPFDQTYINMKYKKDRVEIIDPKIILASTELQRQCYKSRIFRQRCVQDIFYIPIDETVYKPMEKKRVRQEFNLPENKKIIFFGAYSVTNRRKGFAELLKALKILETKTLDSGVMKEIHLLLAGHVEEDVLRELSFTYTSLGYLSHNDLPKAFQAADIFASPSIEDSGPMMINQSLMCGTPVVSFEVGVALNLVHNGITGYKAKKFDCVEFADGLLSLLLLDKDSYENISKACRQMGLDKFSLRATARKWQDLLLQESLKN
jgi:glycosyltransferase involved in cell wall biosynthesis